MTDVKTAEGKMCGPKGKCGKILCKIVLVLVIVAAGILGLALTKPDEFHVERSLVMKAAPEAIFPHVNNLKAWEAWSPWMKMDPESTATFEGPEAGLGAAMSWEGKKTGAGTMTIVRSLPSEAIDFRLDFKKPFKGTDSSSFKFEPVEGGTNVTWSMGGHQNLLMKVMSIFMDCDAMIGGTYEDGLASIKTLVEGQ